MIDYVEYSDEKIRIKLPKQLRQQRSQRFFHGNLVRGKPQTQTSIGIDINLDAQYVKAVKQEFRRTEIKNRPPDDKVERLGPCEFGKDGLELLTSFVQPDTGHTFYCWDMIYNLNGFYVMVSIMGSGTREDFESMAREIITSLTLQSSPKTRKSPIAQDRSAIKNVKCGGMRAKDKKHLAKELESLPENLKYLRDPILAVADEDQDMLGCGEIDTTLLDEALQQQEALHPDGGITAQTEELKEWLHDLSTPNEAWAAPVWFALGLMMGYDDFCNEQWEKQT